MFCYGFKYLFSVTNANQFITVIKCSFLDVFVDILSLTVKIDHYNYRSHISLQVAKLAKSAGGQLLIFPTVHVGKVRLLFDALTRKKILKDLCNMETKLFFVFLVDHKPFNI